MRSLLLSFCLVSGLAAGVTLGDGAAAALAAYKSADYDAALPLLRSAALAAPEDPSWQAAELSTLTQLDWIDEAAALDAHLSTAFPNSSPVLASRGEWAYHMGDFPSAEHLFKAAIQLDDNNARAVFGMSLLCWAASFHHTARLYCLRAHALDADDAFITRQRNVGLNSFDLNGSSPVPDVVRTSGILGIPVLSLFRLTIDYCNGLVDFDYIGDH